MLPGLLLYFLLGWGANPGSFSLFSFSLSHFTAELQWPPHYLSSEVELGAAVAQLESERE